MNHQAHAPNVEMSKYYLQILTSQSFYSKRISDLNYLITSSPQIRSITTHYILCNLLTPIETHKPCYDHHRYHYAFIYASIVVSVSYVHKVELIQFNILPYLHYWENQFDLQSFRAHIINKYTYSTNQQSHSLTPSHWTRTIYSLCHSSSITLTQVLLVMCQYHVRLRA